MWSASTGAWKLLSKNGRAGKAPSPFCLLITPSSSTPSTPPGPFLQAPAPTSEGGRAHAWLSSNSTHPKGHGLMRRRKGVREGGGILQIFSQPPKNLQRGGYIRFLFKSVEKKILQILRSATQGK